MNLRGVDRSLDASMRDAIASELQRPTLAQAQHSMWQREMERAETEAWFRQPAERTSQTTAVAVKVERASRAVQQPLRRSLGEEADVSSTRRKTLATDPDGGAVDPLRASAPPIGMERLASSGSAATGTPPAAVNTDSTATGTATIRPALDERRTSVTAIEEASRVGKLAAPLRLPEQVRSNEVSPVGEFAVARASSPSAESPLIAATSTATPPPELRAPPRSDVEAEPRSGTLPVINETVVEPDDGVPVHRALQLAMDRVPGLRMHVEWADGAAAVWVGIDRAAETTLPDLIARLSETLSRNGLGLRSVVCNGIRRFQSLAPRSGAESQSRPVDIFIESDS